MRLAAIDVGSNSVHMVIADVSADGRIRVCDRLKEMVRLGRRTFTTGALPDEAMDLAVQTLSAFHRLIHARHVDRVATVATSAVREASNRTAFIRRLRRDTGLDVRVIPGIREAQLIFRAVRHALGLERGRHLLIDIGGGSMELTLVDGGRARWMRSFPVGVARLTEAFIATDPPRPSQVARLEKHLERVLGPTLRIVRRAGVDVAIGTSGTITTLVGMAYAATDRELVRMHGASVPVAEVHAVRQRIVGASADERIELPGMESKRVDLMPAAAVLLDFTLRRAGVSQLQSCSWALREGVLLDLAGVAGRPESAATIQRRSVEELAARFGGRTAHGRHVARLAGRLFDGFREALGLPAALRPLLEFAGLLHDVGDTVDHDRHHLHSAYLIRNAELLHFAPHDIELLAVLVRSHRKQIPKATAPELAALPPGLRKQVRPLAALLRLADALDRTHFGVVKELRVAIGAESALITLNPKEQNAELELWAAERRTEPLARLLGRPVTLRLAPRRRSSVRSKRAS